MSVNLETQAQSIAEVIDGHVVDSSGRVAVSVKGTVSGFPATIEAIYPSWPFGVMYQLETSFSADPNAKPDKTARPAAQITLYPRMGRGITSLFTKLLLFESSSMPVGDKHLEKLFNFSYDNSEVAERFARYPGVSDYLTALEGISKFSELVVKTDTGVFLAQPTAFNSLDPEVCRATFRTLADLGQILFEAF